MGCDIHAFAEVKRNGKWEKVGDVFPLDEFTANYRKKSHGDEFYDNRSYSVFGFLANVRNYSSTPFLSMPRGIPADISDDVRALYERWDGDGHSHSWLSARELTEFNYDAAVVDRRITRQIGPNSFDGGCTATAAEEHLTTQEPWRDFLGEYFLKHVEVLKTLGAPDDVRIVFWFDN